MRNLIDLVENCRQPAEDRLVEAMQTNLEGLALNVDQTGRYSVLYDPKKTDLPDRYFVLATASILLLKPQDKLWIVGGIAAKHGFGPVMYAVLAALVAQQDGLLIPSDIRSKAAIDVWTKFERNPFVTVEPLPDREGQRGSFNLSPTGFAIRANGGLMLEPLLAHDREKRAELGERWHGKMVAAAVQRMKTAVNR